MKVRATSCSWGGGDQRAGGRGGSYLAIVPRLEGLAKGLGQTGCALLDESNGELIHGFGVAVKGYHAVDDTLHLIVEGTGRGAQAATHLFKSMHQGGLAQFVVHLDRIGALAETAHLPRPRLDPWLLRARGCGIGFHRHRRQTLGHTAGLEDTHASGGGRGGASYLAAGGIEL